MSTTHPGVSEEELHAHFATLPPRYFQVSPTREILDDLIQAHGARKNRRDTGGTS